MVKSKGKSYFFFKRVFDIVSTFILITLISWLIIILIIINIFATKGAAFYADQRIGYKNKGFRLLKFRSMYIDAETRPEKYLNEEQLKSWKKERKVKDDPRITKFGRFLRKSSLDELPQLFNIFIGQMSVVGPRPIVEKEFQENYTEEERELFVSAKPGLISNWGVNGRSNVDYKDGERQRLELEYFSKRSLWYDLKLIFKAVWVVLTGKGAK